MLGMDFVVRLLMRGTAGDALAASFAASTQARFAVATAALAPLGLDRSGQAEHQQKDKHRENSQEAHNGFLFAYELQRAKACFRQWKPYVKREACAAQWHTSYRMARLCQSGFVGDAPQVACGTLAADSPRL
jgi:hypothetical protein